MNLHCWLLEGYPEGSQSASLRHTRCGRRHLAQAVRRGATHIEKPHQSVGLLQGCSLSQQCSYYIGLTLAAIVLLHFINHCNACPSLLEAVICTNDFPATHTAFTKATFGHLLTCEPFSSSLVQLLVTYTHTCACSGRKDITGGPFSIQAFLQAGITCPASR